MTQTQETWQEKMMRQVAELDQEELGAGEEGNTQNVNLAKQKTDNQNVEGDNQASAFDNLVNLAGEPNEPELQTENAPSTDYEKEISNLRAELQRYRSEDGRARQLANTVRELEEKNRQLLERLNEERRVQPLDGDVDVFSEDEKEIISDDAQRIIGSRFAKMRRELEDLQRHQNEMLERFSRVDGLARQNDREEMMRSIKQKFPNFETMFNGDAWSAFCKETDPVSKVSNGKLFLNAFEHSDTSAVNTMIERFMYATGVGSGHIAVGARAPESSAFTLPTQSGQVQMFNHSEVNSFLQKAMSGMIDLTDPKNVAKYNSYKAALDEGRVYMD